MKKIILIITIIIISNICIAQNFEKDTIPVVLLISDTSNYKLYPYTMIDSVTSLGEYQHIIYDTVYTGYYRLTYWDKGFEIKEKHNTREYVNDPYFNQCTDSNGLIIDCYHDYWIHLKYINKYKKDFSKNIIIWQSK